MTYFGGIMRYYFAKMWNRSLADENNQLGAKEEYERLTSSGAYILADQASGLRETIEYKIN